MTEQEKVARDMTDSGKSATEAELTEEDLAEVAGGKFNPQPIPPG